MFSFLKSDKNKTNKTNADNAAVENIEQKTSLFSRLKKGLNRTRSNLTDGLSNLVLGAKTIDDELMEQIEDILITADLGMGHRGSWYLQQNRWRCVWRRKQLRSFAAA